MKVTVPPSIHPCYMSHNLEDVTDSGSVLTFRENVLAQKGPGGPAPNAVLLMVLTTSFMKLM